MVDGLKRAFEGCLPAEKRNEVKRPVEEEERRGEAADNPRFEKQLSQDHDQRKHANHRKNAENVQAPDQIQTEEFEISRQEIEQEMIADWFAGKMRIFGGKVMTERETLDDGRVRTVVAPLVSADE